MNTGTNKSTEVVQVTTISWSTDKGVMELRRTYKCTCGDFHRCQCDSPMSMDMFAVMGAKVEQEIIMDEKTFHLSCEKLNTAMDIIDEHGHD